MGAGDQMKKAMDSEYRLVRFTDAEDWQTNFAVLRIFYGEEEKIIATSECFFKENSIEEIKNQYSSIFSAFEKPVLEMKKNNFK